MHQSFEQLIATKGTILLDDRQINAGRKLLWRSHAGAGQELLLVSHHDLAKYGKPVPISVILPETRFGRTNTTVGYEGTVEGVFETRYPVTSADCVTPIVRFTLLEGEGVKTTKVIDYPVPDDQCKSYDFMTNVSLRQIYQVIEHTEVTLREELFPFQDAMRLRDVNIYTDHDQLPFASHKLTKLSLPELRTVLAPASSIKVVPVRVPQGQTAIAGHDPLVETLQSQNKKTIEQCLLRSIEGFHAGEASVVHVLLKPNGAIYQGNSRFDFNPHLVRLEHHCYLIEPA